MSDRRGREGWTTPLKWWGDHPWPDLLLAVLVGIGSFASVVDQPVVHDGGQRLGFYNSAGSIVAVVGGLAGISVSVYMGMSGSRSAALRAGAGPAIIRNWVWTLLATAFSALTCWSAQLADVSVGPRYAWAMVFAGVTWCVATSLRQAWLLRSMLRVFTADQTHGPMSSPAPTLAARFTESVVEGQGQHPQPPGHSSEGHPGSLRL